MIRKASLPRIIFIVSLMLIAILILNLAAFYVENEFAFFIDVSPKKLYSVSDETKKLCRGLSDEVMIYFYNSPGNEDAGTKALLESYNAKCDNISVVSIAGESAESFVTRFGEGMTIPDGSVIVTNRDFSRYRVLPVHGFYQDGLYTAELSISSAIRYADTGSIMTAKFLTGHRETDLSQLTKFSSLITSLDFRYASFDAMLDPELDPKSDILIAVSPRTDLLEEEYRKLTAFLLKGGKAMFFMDRADLPLFGELLKERDMALADDVIIGTDPAYTNMEQTSIIVRSVTHELTRKLGGSSVVLSRAMPVAMRADTEKVSVLLSSDESCVLSGFEAEKAAFPVCAEYSDGESCVVLMGTAYPVTNGGIDVSGNGEFLSVMLDSFSDLGVDIQPKTVRPTEKAATVSYIQQVLIGFFAIMLLPICALAAGLFLRRYVL